ncbi:MAG TPA: FG-GAP-like repeat-containing protein, partial [Polyangia bacterium]|nr:FG-GAP-like repeat-containing protein [Polyangia bacterium]
GATRVYRYGQSGVEDFGFSDGEPGPSGSGVVRGSAALDVNNYNQFVGYFTNLGITHGYRYTDGIGVEDVSDLGLGMTMMAGIGETGRAVGESLKLSPQGVATIHAVLFDNSFIGLVDLNDLIDPLSGWELTNATRSSGDFVIGSGTYNGQVRSYRRNVRTGAIHEIYGGWNNQEASDVNVYGDVVGWGSPGGGLPQAAFVYTDQLGFKNLNDMVSVNSNWDLRAANAINDAGAIAGWGYRAGVTGRSAFRVQLPSARAATCESRGVCGGDGDAICLYSDGIAEVGEGRFMAIFGFDNAASTSVQPTVNEVRYDGTLVLSPQPPPPTRLPSGTHSGAFLPTFDAGHTISWTVNGETVTASASNRRLPTVDIAGGGLGVVVEGRTIVIRAPTIPYTDPPSSDPGVQAERQYNIPFEGALQGQFAVSPTGAATYTVPIAIPPGIGGMAPNLSLAYNSQGGLGIAGQGWDLAGLSVIHRCAKTRVQDGVGHQVSMDPNDLDEGVCMDGKRMFDQDGDPLTFKLEQDDHSTIKKVLDSSGYDTKTLSGVWFKVVTKTGETRYYGQTYRTRVSLGSGGDVAVWALERVVDDWGNYFEVRYNGCTDTSCAPNFGTDGLFVTSINYTGHVPTNSGGGGGTAPFAHVKFEYDPRRETRRARFNTTTLPRNKRLRSISTYVDVNGTSELTGTYSLTYAPDYVPHANYDAVTNDPMLPTRLTSIGYCSVDHPVPPPPGVPKPHCMKSLDFVWDGGGYQWNEKPAFAPPEPIGRTGENDDHIPTSYGSQFVDLDGDGRVDFVRSHGGFRNRQTDTTPYSVAYRNTGQGWEPRQDWKLPVALANDDGTSTGAMFADVNGDGLPDLIYRVLIPCAGSNSPPSACSARLEVRLNQIRKDPTNPWPVISGYSTIPGNWGGGWFDFMAQEHVLDMNGDGRADIVHVGSDGTTQIQVRYANQAGTGWDIPAEDFDSTLLDAGAVHNSAIRFEDINRDGLPDMVAGNQDSFCYAGAYAINTGKNHVQVIDDSQYNRVWDTRLPYWCDRDQTPRVPADKRVVGDIDGDGVRDVMSSFTLKELFASQPGAGTCTGIICSCGFGRNAGTCSGEGTSCDCSCPTGYSISDAPFLRFATGLGWGGDGSDS